MREPVDVLFQPYSRAAYRAIKLTLGGAMKSLYRVRVEGLHNVPAMLPGIVATNHVSFLDSLFIPLAIPRRVTYLAKAEYWDSWKTRWFFDLVGQIPVRRDDSEKAQAALEAGLQVLHAGGLLGIYPEGTRSPDGLLYRGKTGVARMAAEAGCSVIPTGIVGSREIMSKEAKLPKLRGDVVVRFGPPLRISREQVASDPLALRTFTDELMYEIAKLSGQEYVDRYADRKVKAPAIPVAPVEPAVPAA